jgi:hypothetical protein
VRYKSIDSLNKNLLRARARPCKALGSVSRTEKKKKELAEQLLGATVTPPAVNQSQHKQESKNIGCLMVTQARKENPAGEGN